MLFSYHLLYFCTALFLIIILSSNHLHKSKTLSQLTQCPFTGTLLLFIKSQCYVPRFITLKFKACLCELLLCICRQEHGQLQNDKANVGTSPDSLKSNCKITIKDTTNYVPKLDEPQSRTVVFNISHQSRVVGTSAKSTSSHSLINSKPDVFLEVKKESTESKNKEASQSDNDWVSMHIIQCHTVPSFTLTSNIILEAWQL